MLGFGKGGCLIAAKRNEFVLPWINANARSRPFWAVKLLRPARFVRAGGASRRTKEASSAFQRARLERKTFDLQIFLLQIFSTRLVENLKDGSHFSPFRRSASLQDTVFLHHSRTCGQQDTDEDRREKYSTLKSDVNEQTLTLSELLSLDLGKAQLPSNPRPIHFTGQSK